MPSHGERKRQEILGKAVDLGSAQGLSSLTIGGLADATGMSRSGLFGHFGSKQGLQLATVRAAQADFEERVYGPARDAEPGLDRLRSLYGSWLDYVQHIEFRGGCFFAMTSAEFASQPGPVRDLIAQLSLAWIRELVVAARTALRQGELRPDADPERIVFHLHALMQEANWSRELLEDPNAFERARIAANETLAAASIGETSP